MELLEQLYGVGDISENGMPLGKTNYELQIYQECIEEEKGLINIIGKITSSDAFRFFDKNSLNLTIEDGRSIKFFICNTDGDIQCSGGFYKLEN